MAIFRKLSRSHDALKVHPVRGSPPEEELSTGSVGDSPGAELYRNHSRSPCRWTYGSGPLRNVGSGSESFSPNLVRGQSHTRGVEGKQGSWHN